ncbi:hypothetical protein COT75_01635 [Candidatus Beckwithbacteria bacterium CG10_big_fil_rev_8_21_14_0_10_34_10]|uniref:Class I SAM-dependent methyltransferase n=1 Tax=Candidatus Beckwithbacteria bacterium CG10_big_fil_rev_8_21_14_0_10_34_10 TaxID=1974495 RepID=A0A2H0WBT5_9BACT|nr:MAG: hypothetical protein COT75_01635 [Candidatus Beckwithbacteria bacterium CG10_big_fil_rev_8_21_14_0_10_34_10]
MNGLLSPLLRYLRFKKAISFIPKGKKILDIGCGSGEMIDYLPKKTDYFGIEGNKQRYQEACQKYGEEKFINSYFNTENFTSLELFKQDIVLMLAVLEHLDEPFKIVKNLSKHLNKKGRIIITTPDKKAKTILELGVKIRIFSRQNKDHKHYFSKKELIQLAKEADLEVKYYQSFEFGLNHFMVLGK